MDRQRADAGNVGRLERALHRVSEERLPDTLALPASSHREPRKQHDRYRVAGQTLGQPLRPFLAGDLSDRERVVADDRITDETDIGLRRACLLIGPGVAEQITVQFLPAAVETFEIVIGTELFNAAFSAH